MDITIKGHHTTVELCSIEPQGGQAEAVPGIKFTTPNIVVAGESFSIARHYSKGLWTTCIPLGALAGHNAETILGWIDGVAEYAATHFPIETEDE